MSAHPHARPHTRTRTAALVAAAAALVLTLAACGSSADGMPGMSHGSAATDSSAAAGQGGGHSGHQMPGSAPTAGSTTGSTTDSAAVRGLAAEQGGYRFTAAADTLPAGAAAEYRFTVTGPDGKPVTAFTVEQTKRLHFYAVRADLTGFQHLHPELAADGTWTAPLSALAPGNWRVYASFTPDSGPGKGTALVLSRPVTVPGEAAPVAVPTATVDGYTVTVAGVPGAGAAGRLTATVSKDGKPVTDLQPYLESYAHLTAFHAGDQAFAHLHPEAEAKDGAATGGPTLSFHAELPAAGDWRLYLQFQTAGTLHTAAVDVRVAG